MIESLAAASSLTPFRRELLELTPAPVGLLAENPTFAFVWPTLHCSIGCAHCNFGSVPLGAKTERRAIDPASLVAWLHEARAEHLVLCGGGEPLDDPEFCLETVASCSASAMNFGIYTSGSSLSRPRRPAEYLREWQRAWGAPSDRKFSIRLSVDVFHERRIGLDDLAEWITLVTKNFPDWRLSLRGLRVIGDDSFEKLACALHGELRPYGERGLRLALPTGRLIPIERMAYIVDGRGSLDLLHRSGLALPGEHKQSIESWMVLVARSRRLGRPLSRRLTVSSKRVDLEIHPDAAIHVLESQARDHRASYRDLGWDEMRASYYRDPIIHAVAAGGLEFVARVIAAAITKEIARPETVPFSVERLDQFHVLDWVTAMLVSEPAAGLTYSKEAKNFARQGLRPAA